MAKCKVSDVQNIAALRYIRKSIIIDYDAYLGTVAMQWRLALANVMKSCEEGTIVKSYGVTNCKQNKCSDREHSSWTLQ